MNADDALYPTARETVDRINRLNERLGIGKGAKRERERLNRDLRRHGVQMVYTNFGLDGGPVMSTLVALDVSPGNYDAVVQQVQR